MTFTGCSKRCDSDTFETWRKYRDTPYYVSNRGRIYAKPCQGGKGGLRKISPDKKDGYCRFSYTLNKVRYNCKVHRMVAECFLPNPEDKATVNHLNGVKTDNSISNLEWATYKENVNHADATGLRTHFHKRGECGISAKLSDAQVAAIRAETYIPKSRKFGAESIGRKYGCTGAQVLNLIHNRQRIF